MRRPGSSGSSTTRPPTASRSSSRHSAARSASASRRITSSSPGPRRSGPPAATRPRPASVVMGLRARKDADEVERMRSACRFVTEVMEQMFAELEVGRGRAGGQRPRRAPAPPARRDGLAPARPLRAERGQPAREPGRPDARARRRGLRRHLRADRRLLGRPDALRHRRRAVGLGAGGLGDGARGPGRRDRGGARRRSPPGTSTRRSVASSSRVPTSAAACTAPGTRSAPKSTSRRSSIPRTTAPLEAGMCLTIEPGIYRAGVGGIRLEDQVLITDDGPELVSDLPLELRMIGELARADTRGRRHRRDLHRSRPPRRGDRRRRPGQGGDDTAAFEEGVLDAVGQTELSDVEFLAHGTTVVINALTERKGARVGLITTAGLPRRARDREGQPARPLQLRVPQADAVRAAPPALRGRASGSTTRAAWSQPLDEEERTRGRPRPARRGRRGGRDLPAALVREPGARAARGGDRRRGVAGHAASPSRTSSRASGASTTARRRRCSTRTSSRPSASYLTRLSERLDDGGIGKRHALRDAVERRPLALRRRGRGTDQPRRVGAGRRHHRRRGRRRGDRPAEPDHLRRRRYDGEVEPHRGRRRSA